VDLAGGRSAVAISATASDLETGLPRSATPVPRLFRRSFVLLTWGNFASAAVAFVPLPLASCPHGRSDKVFQKSRMDHGIMNE
jgi:hypothetical protein